MVTLIDYSLIMCYDIRNPLFTHSLFFGHFSVLKKIQLVLYVMSVTLRLSHDLFWLTGVSGFLPLCRFAPSLIRLWLFHPLAFCLLVFCLLADSSSHLGRLAHSSFANGANQARPLAKWQIGKKSHKSCLFARLIIA